MEIEIKSIHERLPMQRIETTEPEIDTGDRQSHRCNLAFARLVQYQLDTSCRMDNTHRSAVQIEGQWFDCGRQGSHKFAECQSHFTEENSRYVSIHSR